MNYCTIEDAWGKSNYVSNEFKEYMTNTPNQEQNRCQTVNNNCETNLNNNIVEISDCENLIIHIRSCRKCYNKLKNHFKPQLIESFQGLIDENRDIIVIFLIGISILLFFNLVNNITK